jgi:hypothetical protein
MAPSATIILFSVQYTVGVGGGGGSGARSVLPGGCCECGAAVCLVCVCRRLPSETGLAPPPPSQN